MPKVIDMATLVGMTSGQAAAWRVMSTTEWMSFTEIDKVILAEGNGTKWFWFNTLASMEKRGWVERLPKNNRKQVDLWMLKNNIGVEW